MNTVSLGEVSALADSEIVTKAGESVGGFSVQEGVPLEAKERALARASEGMSSETSRAVREALDESGKGDAVALSTYGERFLFVVETEDRGWEGRIGKEGVRLTPIDFFRRAGAAEEVNDAERTQVAWFLLALVGAVALPVGASASASGSDNPEPSSGFVTLIGGAAICLGGLYAGMGVSPGNSQRAREVADSHNKALREELGLPDNIPNPVVVKERRLSRAELTSPPSVQLGLGFAPAQGGGVIGVVGRF